MNDFELRRELRELRVDREPQHDLWPRIAQRLNVADMAPTRTARRPWLPFAVAASIALALTAGVFSLALQRRPRLRIAHG